MTQPTQLEINLPAELESGAFANFAGVWQDDAGFVLDFATTTHPPQMVEDHVQVKAKVVSRVRIPPRQALELMRALNTQLGLWEQQHGPVAPAEE
jgi:hypothetical protein